MNKNIEAMGPLLIESVCARQKHVYYLYVKNFVSVLKIWEKAFSYRSCQQCNSNIYHLLWYNV